MSVALVVDGGASVPSGALCVPAVVVPMRLEMGGQGPSRRVSAGGSGARTAAAAPGAFLEAIEAADTGEGVVVVTVAKGLSASFSAARAAATLAGRGDAVEVVDSRSATAGQGLVVLAAAAAASQGLGVAAVAAAARQAADEVRLVAQIERLDELARGGRLPAGVARATRRAGVRVLFELRDGRIRPLRPALGLPAAEARILAALRGGGGATSPLQVAALHAAAPASAERLLEGAAATAQVVERFLTELSPLMLAHTGTGVSGLAWRPLAGDEGGAGSA